MDVQRGVLLCNLILSVGLFNCTTVVVAAEGVGVGEGGGHPSTYIVHMDKSVMPTEFSSHENWYRSLIFSVKGVSASTQSDFYHYTYDIVMHGFSAKITQFELDILEEMPGNLLSFPDPVGKLHTTHSPEFLGLNPDVGLLPRSRFGQDVIVAIMDTRIWPESQSFLDHGMKPVPARWKGTCENGTAFDPSLYNKKLIGARSFNKGAVAKFGIIDPALDYGSARDFYGHGSHTSSTVGGNYVEDVNYYSYGAGTARGVAPAGRIAMYKCVWATGSVAAIGSDVLAAMESAISDRADVLSLSIGFPPSPYFTDVMALEAFAVVKRGILVVCSAGNNGPYINSVLNGAPWIFTVGASTLDRDFAATLTLGDGEAVNGLSFYGRVDSNKGARLPSAPLVYDKEDPHCKNKLEPAKVNGTVVLCTNASVQLVFAAENTGALAFVLVGTDTEELREYLENQFPLIIINPGDEAGATTLVHYAATAPNPVVDMEFGVTVLGYKPAPSVADFSSRGLNIQSPNILKPDVIAHSVDILAAWLPSSVDGSNYVVDSGTSMSCLHVAGISALVKVVHSEWSPSAIKSAIMTTSYTLDNSNNTITDLGYDGRPATPFEFGAGHVNPEKAVNPGLVYDVGEEEYVNFLCMLNYTTQQIQIITRTPISCPADLQGGADALNYPSFIAIFNRNVTSNSTSQTFKRTLTNVGDDDVSSYRASVEGFQGLKIQVNPTTLEFTKKLQKLDFTITVEAEQSTDVVYGHLNWIDNKGHVVKSPVVALFE